MSGRGKGSLMKRRTRRSANDLVDVVAWPYGYMREFVQRSPPIISHDSRLSVTSASLIGGALGMTVPLLVIVGLLCLVLRRGRSSIVGKTAEWTWDLTKDAKTNSI